MSTSTPSANTVTTQAATDPNALPLDALSLIGVMTGPKRRIALIRAPGGKVHRVTPGARFGTTEVLAIGPQHVELRKGGRTLQLALPR